MTETTEAKTFDEEYVKDLRNEAANYRIKLREREQELEQFKQKEQGQERKLLESEILAKAKEAGAVDPHTVAQLVDLDSIEKDDEGNFVGVDEKVTGLIEEKPFLKGGTVGKASNPADGNGQPQIFTRAQVDQMSVDEINANWETIQEQMSKGLIK